MSKRARQDYNDASITQNNTYEDVYKETADKEAYIKSLGNNLVTMWECDYLEEVSELRIFFYSYSLWQF